MGKIWYIDKCIIIFMNRNYRKHKFLNEWTTTGLIVIGVVGVILIILIGLIINVLLKK